jgi:hypothetical protein
MNIIRALKREEARLEKYVKNMAKQAALKATMKFLGSTTPGTKLVYGEEAPQDIGCWASHDCKSYEAALGEVASCQGEKSGPSTSPQQLIEACGA